jgi:hypothetical protein
MTPLPILTASGNADVFLNEIFICPSVSHPILCATSRAVKVKSLAGFDRVSGSG